MPTVEGSLANTWGRWWLATVMIHYSIFKIFCQQFGTAKTPTSRSARLENIRQCIWPGSSWAILRTISALRACSSPSCDPHPPPKNGLPRTHYHRWRSKQRLCHELVFRHPGQTLLWPLSTHRVDTTHTLLASSLRLDRHQDPIPLRGPLHQAPSPFRKSVVRDHFCFGNLTGGHQFRERPAKRRSVRENASAHPLH